MSGYLSSVAPAMFENQTRQLVNRRVWYRGSHTRYPFARSRYRDYRHTVWPASRKCELPPLYIPYVKNHNGGGSQIDELDRWRQRQAYPDACRSSSEVVMRLGCRVLSSAPPVLMLQSLHPANPRQTVPAVAQSGSRQTRRCAPSAYRSQPFAAHRIARMIAAIAPGSSRHQVQESS